MSAPHSAARPEALARGTILAFVSLAMNLLVFVVPTDEDLDGTVYVVASLFVVLGAVFCWGLWNLRRWGGWGTVVLSAVNILLSLPAAFQDLGMAITILTIVMVVVGVAGLFLILQPASRAAWNHKG